LLVSACFALVIPNPIRYIICVVRTFTWYAWMNEHGLVHDTSSQRIGKEPSVVCNTTAMEWKGACCRVCVFDSDYSKDAAAGMLNVLYLPPDVRQLVECMLSCQ
jgi:hypothetical protein